MSFMSWALSMAAAPEPRDRGNAEIKELAKLKAESEKLQAEVAAAHRNALGAAPPQDAGLLAPLAFLTVVVATAHAAAVSLAGLLAAAQLVFGGELDGESLQFAAGELVERRAESGWEPGIVCASLQTGKHPGREKTVSGCGKRLPSGLGTSRLRGLGWSGCEAGWPSQVLSSTMSSARLTPVRKLPLPPYKLVSVLEPLLLELCPLAAARQRLALALGCSDSTFQLPADVVGAIVDHHCELERRELAAVCGQISRGMSPDADQQEQSSAGATPVQLIEQLKNPDLRMIRQQLGDLVPAHNAGAMHGQWVPRQWQIEREIVALAAEAYTKQPNILPDLIGNWHSPIATRILKNAAAAKPLLGLLANLKWPTLWLHDKCGPDLLIRGGGRRARDALHGATRLILRADVAAARGVVEEVEE
jgi:hypothetical protein